jgi:glycosyltransferase involved in cell wall biosynthesis
MAPLVSIIINCYNQAHYLERSVNSVLAQTFTDLECVIVDDGSTDNTREVAEKLMELDSRVRYCYKENGGLPAARNFGVQQAKGEWIQCLDADDWIHEDKTRFQLEHLKGWEDPPPNPLLQKGGEQEIVFYCDYDRVFIDADEQIVETQENIIGHLNSEELIQRLLIPDFLAGSPHPALQQCMLMKRSIFQKCQFPEEMKALGDRYFGVDILVNGVTFVYVPMVGAFYTKHKGNRTNSWKYMKNYYILFYEKVYREQPDLRKLCHIGLEFLLNEAIRDREQENFDRLVKITEIPINLKIWNLSWKIYGSLGLRLAYGLRSLIPSFLLYEKYQGPRSKKILSWFKK